MKSTQTHRISRFQKGSSTYSCTVCGKLTRDTGDGEDMLHQCADCYESGGDANAVADGHMSEAEFVAKWKRPSGY